MEYTNIIVERENRVATIRLNRPDVLNALGPEMLREISSAVAEAGNDESIRVLVIRGEGRVFSAGADLNYFQTALEDTALLPDYLTQVKDTFGQIENLPIPVIAVVHGFALAGGLELMMACDMALVAAAAAPSRGATKGHGTADHRQVAVRRRSRGLGSGPARCPSRGTGRGIGETIEIPAHQEPRRHRSDKIGDPARPGPVHRRRRGPGEPRLRAVHDHLSPSGGGDQGLQRKTPTGVLGVPQKQSGSKYEPGWFDTYLGRCYDSVSLLGRRSRLLSTTHRTAFKDTITLRRQVIGYPV